MGLYLHVLFVCHVGAGGWAQYNQNAELKWILAWISWVLLWLTGVRKRIGIESHWGESYNQSLCTLQWDNKLFSSFHVQGLSNTKFTLELTSDTLGLGSRWCIRRDTKLFLAWVVKNLLYLNFVQAARIPKRHSAASRRSALSYSQKKKTHFSKSLDFLVCNIAAENTLGLGWKPYGDSHINPEKS